MSWTDDFDKANQEATQRREANGTNLGYGKPSTDRHRSDARAQSWDAAFAKVRAEKPDAPPKDQHRSAGIAASWMEAFRQAGATIQQEQSK